MNKHTV